MHLRSYVFKDAFGVHTNYIMDVNVFIKEDIRNTDGFIQADVKDLDVGYSL